jgi:hypothetical protein
MQDFEASDGVATTNIDTTITATRIGSPPHHQIQTLPRSKYRLWQSLETDACKLWPVLKDNVFVLLTATPIWVDHSEYAGRAFR